MAISQMKRISLLFSKSSLDDVLKTIQKVDKKIEKVELFDIYQGAGVLPGMKSVAISVILRDKNKTLVEKEIVDISNKIVAKVEKDYGAVLRQ